MEIKRRCGWHGCSLCGRGHDVKLCPSSILLLHGRQDWYPVTGLWYGEVINAFAAPPRKLPQYRWAGCRWQAELSARCPVCSDLSRFGSGEGRGGDGSEVIGGLSKDTRGAIHDFMFPSLVRVIHLQSQRIDTLMRSNHVQTCVFVFFLKLGRVVVFWRRHRRLLWSWRGVCDLCTIFFWTTAFGSYLMGPSESARTTPKNIKNSLGRRWFS